MPTFAITGSNGFIASHLVKHLISQGHTVRGTVRDAATSGKHVEALGATVFEVKDMKDSAALEKAFAGVDGVFHMAAVHPEYGFQKTPEGREEILKVAVDGTTAVLSAANNAGVKRIVLTSSLAAIECGNDEGVLTESTWSRAEVYDSKEKLEQTRWNTHYTYVKSKVEQEKAAIECAKKLGLDMRVVVPGNLVVGPVESAGINGTMTRLRDIMSGKNTLTGAADLAIVHVTDVIETHARCMTNDEANGRYIVAPATMPTIEDVFASLREMYPQMPVAPLDNLDIASGVPHKSRKIETRVGDLGVELKPYTQALQDAVDSMIAKKLVAAEA